MNNMKTKKNYSNLETKKNLLDPKIELNGRNEAKSLGKYRDQYSKQPRTNMPIANRQPYIKHFKENGFGELLFAPRWYVFECVAVWCVVKRVTVCDSIFRCQFYE